MTNSFNEVTEMMYWQCKKKTKISRGSIFVFLIAMVLQLCQPIVLAVDNTNTENTKSYANLYDESSNEEYSRHTISLDILSADISNSEQAFQTKVDDKNGIILNAQNS